MRESANIHALTVMFFLPQTSDSPPGEETRPHTEPSETKVKIHALEPQRETYSAETRDNAAIVTTEAETVTPRLQMESHEQEPVGEGEIDCSSEDT